MLGAGARLATRVGGSQFGKFVLVGALVAGLYLGSLWALIEYTALPLAASIAIAYALAALSRFLLHRVWVFDAVEGKIHHQASRYAVLLLGVYVTNVAITESLLAISGMEKIHAAVIGTAVVTVLAYFVSSKWVFK